MKIGRYYIEFYNVRKHRPFVTGIDHFATGDRDCRPFAEADIQSLLMMISGRMRNVVWQDNPQLLIFDDLFKFMHDNTLKIMMSLFYDGMVTVDMSDPFRPCFVGERMREEELCAKDVAVVYDEIYLLEGKTRAQVLKPHIDMLNTVNDSDLNLIMNYGAMGILSPENSARTDGYLDDEQIEEIQKDYRKKYGVRFGKWALLITRTPVRYQRIDLPIKELELHEKRKSALAEIMQYMNIPKELHAQFESAKYANRNEAELDMYGNCVTAWAWKFLEIARECYRVARLYSNDGITYPADVELWFDIVGVPALQEAQWQEKVKAREELAMWRELRVEMPERAEEIERRINDLIENM